MEKHWIIYWVVGLITLYFVYDFLKFRCLYKLLKDWLVTEDTFCLTPETEDDYEDDDDVFKYLTEESDLDIESDTVQPENSKKINPSLLRYNELKSKEKLTMDEMAELSRLHNQHELGLLGEE